MTGESPFLNLTNREGSFDKDNNDVYSVIEDRSGKFWFGTRGRAYIYDGKTFTVFTYNNETFKGIRKIIEDKKGDIWLGGIDGLWRYNGITLTNFTQNSVGDILEDKNGNIWTISQNVNDGTSELSRYDAGSLSDKTPTPTIIKSEFGNKPMVFGILEANDGSIWFGAVDGVYRYDGNVVTDFKEGRK